MSMPENLYSKKGKNSKIRITNFKFFYGKP